MRHEQHQILAASKPNYRERTALTDAWATGIHHPDDFAVIDRRGDVRSAAILLAMSSYTTGILSPSIGQSMFTVLAFLELFMVCAITPAVTAGAISGEREKLTYEMLQSTPLSTASIVWGKLVSALSYIFLLLFAAIPLASLVFIFGGVTLRDMFKVLLMLVIIAVSFGVLGLFMSALFKRTGRATIATFLVILGLMFVPLLVAIAVGLISRDTPPRWILAPSPISMLSSVLGQASGQNGPLEELSLLWADILWTRP